jgi:hypothetical protein
MVHLVIRKADAPLDARALDALDSDLGFYNARVVRDASGEFPFNLEGAVHPEGGRLSANHIAIRLDRATDSRLVHSALNEAGKFGWEISHLIKSNDGFDVTVPDDQVALRPGKDGRVIATHLRLQ